jgi:hypothetical protein
MKPDEFEQQLQKRPMRPLPAEWRAGILKSAQAAAPPRLSVPDARPARWLRELLWPCPQVWAGLAAVWLIILTINALSSGRGKSPEMAARETAPFLEMREALAEKRRLFAELVGSPVKPTEADGRFVPRPRSERRAAVICV